MGLLDGKIAAAIAKGFSGKLLAGTLRKVSTTGRDENGDPVTTLHDFACQGFVDDYSAMIRLAAGIPATDSRVTLIAGLTDAVPAIGDRIMFASGQYAGVWWQVRNTGGDPAGATFELQSFKVAT